MPADPVIPDPTLAATAGGIARRRRRLIVAVLLVAHLLGFVPSLDALMSTRTAPGTVAYAGAVRLTGLCRFQVVSMDLNGARSMAPVGRSVSDVGGRSGLRSDVAPGTLLLRDA